MSIIAKMFFPTLEPKERRMLACALGVIIVVALVVSLALHGMVRTNFDNPAHDGYLQLARSLVAGHGYRFSSDGTPVLFRPPAYVLLLLPVVLFPESWQPALVIVLNSGLFWGAGCLMYGLARGVYSSPVAKIAVLLLWLNGSILWCLKNPMSWILQIFCMAALAYSFWRASRANFSAKSALGLGAVAGLSILSHGAYLIVIVVAAAGVAAWIGWAKAWRNLVSFALACAMAALVVLPWTWRNYLVSGRFIPVVEGAGHAYFLGNAIAGLPPLNPSITPTPHPFFYSDDVVALEMAGLDKNLIKTSNYGGFPESDTEQRLDQAMMQDMRRAPLHLLPKFIYNGLQMFFPGIHYLWKSPVYQAATPRTATFWYDWAITLGNGAFWIFAVLGWRNLASSIQQTAARLLLFGIAAYMIPYLLLSSASVHAAYAFPTYVLLMPLSALGLQQVFFRRRQTPTASPAP